MATAKVIVEQIGSSTSRGNARGHELVMDRPEARGGSNAGMMGGEAVLNGLGGCFMSNLLAAAKARNIKLSNVRADIEADMAEAPPRFTAIRMSISAQCNSPEELNKLVTIAQHSCTAANTLGAAVELSIKVA
jgi:putative redox protein